MSEGQLWLPLGAASAAAAQKEALQGRSADVGAKPSPPIPSPLSASFGEFGNQPRETCMRDFAAGFVTGAITVAVVVAIYAIASLRLM